MNKILFYFWIYVLTSFLGFIFESIWCFIRHGKIESRKGLIYELSIPIYGIAGVLIILFINKFNLIKWNYVFLLGFIISSVVEFLASLLQEVIFETKSWDYSKIPLNIGGRINLVYSIMFGLVTLISYEAVIVPYLNLFNKININTLFITISILLFLFIIYDIFISVIAVYRMKERRKNIKRNNKFWNHIDNKYTDEYLNKVYANMVNVIK